MMTSMHIELTTQEVCKPCHLDEVLDYLLFPKGNVIPFADVFNTTAPKLNDLLGEPDEVIQFENEWEQVADNAPEGEKEYSETTQTQGEDTASGKGKEKNK